MGGAGSGPLGAAERERAAAEARHGPLIAGAYATYQSAADRLDDAIREALEAGCKVAWTADQVAASTTPCRRSAAADGRRAGGCRCPAGAGPARGHSGTLAPVAEWLAAWRRRSGWGDADRPLIERSD